MRYPNNCVADNGLKPSLLNRLHYKKYFFPDKHDLVLG